MKERASRNTIDSRRILTCALAFFVCVAMCFAVLPSLTPAQAAAKLKAPAKFKCSDKTYKSITLKWAKVKGAKSYVVYICPKGGKFKKAKTVKKGTKCTIAHLKMRGVYKIRVRACKKKSGKGAGKYSKTITVKTLGPETYTISAASKPRNKKMLRYAYYNGYTRMYYTVRSYMERFEKCGGGTLILKSGTYDITNTIFVPSNVTIQLSNGTVIRKGTNTHVKGLKASKSLFHFIKPSKGQSKNVYGGYSGAKNIRILGSGSAVIDMGYQANSNCIEAGHNQNVVIDGVTFRNASAGHFIEMDATKNATIKNCIFLNISDSRNVREAINLDTPDRVTGGFTAAWSKMDKTANYNVKIENCEFKNMPRAIGTHNYSYGHPHRYITIKNCRIDGVSSFGIGMMYWQNSAITGCMINGKYSQDKNAFDGILGFGITNATIYDNDISNFRYPMLMKDYQDPGIKQYSKIYNYISSENLKRLAANTGANLGYNFVFVQNNNGGKSSMRIQIGTAQVAGQSIPIEQNVEESVQEDPGDTVQEDPGVTDETQITEQEEIIQNTDEDVDEPTAGEQAEQEEQEEQVEITLPEEEL